MPKEFVIYTDESDEKGAYFSNFYGGALVTSDHVDDVRERLITRKSTLGLTSELKWNNINMGNYERYKYFLDEFFNIVEKDRIKVRIMFTQNTVIPKGLTKDHIEQKYFILYYQFIKNAFGLVYAPNIQEVRVRLYPDQIPDTSERVEQFRDYLAALSKNKQFRSNGIKIHKQDIAEVDSKNHIILQALDIILGSMSFRLNDKHQNSGNNRIRPKKTRAKEKVYKHINSRIRGIYPNFNIGITKALRGNTSNLWNDPYRHWNFAPRDHQRVKGGKHTK